MSASDNLNPQQFTANSDAKSESDRDHEREMKMARTVLRRDHGYTHIAMLNDSEVTESLAKEGLTMRDVSRIET